MDGSFADISGETSASYTPVVNDDGMFLRVSVSYTDAEGSDKMAMKTSANPVVNHVVLGDESVEYPENGTDPVGTYRTTGLVEASVEWSLSGDDAGDFGISSDGMLTFSSSPDYEAPAGAGTDNVYEVTVVADDGPNSADLSVTVTVTNDGRDWYGNPDADASHRWHGDNRRPDRPGQCDGRHRHVAVVQVHDHGRNLHGASTWQPR